MGVGQNDFSALLDACLSCQISWIDPKEEPDTYGFLALLVLIPWLGK